MKVRSPMYSIGTAIFFNFQQYRFLGDTQLTDANDLASVNITQQPNIYIYIFSRCLCNKYLENC